MAQKLVSYCRHSDDNEKDDDGGRRGGIIFVNDSFNISSSHCNNNTATITGIPKVLLKELGNDDDDGNVCVTGLLMEKEINAFTNVLSSTLSSSSSGISSSVLEKDDRPPAPEKVQVIGMIGGTKIINKIKMIENLIYTKVITTLLIGGAISYTFLNVQHKKQKQKYLTQEQEQGNNNNNINVNTNIIGKSFTQDGQTIKVVKKKKRNGNGNINSINIIDGDGDGNGNGNEETTGEEEEEEEIEISKYVQHILELATQHNVEICLPIDHVCYTRFGKPTAAAAAASNEGEEEGEEEVNDKDKDNDEDNDNDNEKKDEILITENEIIPENYMGLDIGPKTIDLYKSKITNDATKAIIWNGPMGVYEMIDTYSNGTFSLAKTIANETTTNGLLSLIVGDGNGDTVNAIKLSGYAKQMYHISTVGGASFELLEGKPK